MSSTSGEPNDISSTKQHERHEPMTDGPDGRTDMTKTDVTRTDVSATCAPRSTDAPDFRSTEMHLMNEALARAHCMEQRERAMQEQRVRRLMAARRMDRRAAKAAQRARRLAAAAVVLRSRSY